MCNDDDDGGSRLVIQWLKLTIILLSNITILCIVGCMGCLPNKKVVFMSVCHNSKEVITFCHKHSYILYFQHYFNLNNL